jgi:hypothetical protein
MCTQELVECSECLVFIYCIPYSYFWAFFFKNCNSDRRQNWNSWIPFCEQHWNYINLINWL